MGWMNEGVGGLDTLQAMENVETDKKTDRPKEDILIQDTLVFVNPLMRLMKR